LIVSVIHIPTVDVTNAKITPMGTAITINHPTDPSSFLHPMIVAITVHKAKIMGTENPIRAHCESVFLAPLSLHLMDVINKLTRMGSPIPLTKMGI
jgi:hypothetical protein